MNVYINEWLYVYEIDYGKSIFTRCPPANSKHFHCTSPSKFTFSPFPKLILIDP